MVEYKAYICVTDLPARGAAAASISSLDTLLADEAAAGRHPLVIEVQPLIINLVPVAVHTVITGKDIPDDTIAAIAAELRAYRHGLTRDPVGGSTAWIEANKLTERITTRAGSDTLQLGDRS